MILDNSRRKRIARAVASAMKNGLKDAYSDIADEDPVSVNLATSAQNHFNKSRAARDLNMRMRTLKIPSSNKPYEKEIGADLYIAIHMAGEKNQNDVYKGILVQAKKIDKDLSKLKSQCEAMAERTATGAYAWGYDGQAVKVVPAQTIILHGNREIKNCKGQTLEEFWEDVFACIAGDKALATHETFESGQVLLKHLQNIRVGAGVSLEL